MISLILVCGVLLPKIKSSKFGINSVIVAYLFGICPFISYLYSGLTNFTMTIYLSLILSLLSFWVGKKFSGDTRIIYKLILTAGLILTVYAILEYLGIAEKYNYTDWYRVYKSTESSSLMGIHPSHYGFFMGLVLFSSLALLVHGQKQTVGKLILYTLIFLLCLASVFLTNSRSALLFLLSIYIISLFLSITSVRHKIVLLAIVFLTAVASFDLIVFLLDFLELTSSARIESATGRVDIWMAAINLQSGDLFQLFFGIGFGNFGAVLSPVIGYSASHNQLVNLFVEFGIVGSFLWVYVLIDYYVHMKKTNPFKIVFLSIIVASIGSETFLPVKAFESLSMLLFFLAGVHGRRGDQNYLSKVSYEK